VTAPNEGRRQNWKSSIRALPVSFFFPPSRFFYRSEVFRNELKPAEPLTGRRFPSSAFSPLLSSLPECLPPRARRTADEGFLALKSPPSAVFSPLRSTPSLRSPLLVHFPSQLQPPLSLLKIQDEPADLYVFDDPPTCLDLLVPMSLLLRFPHPEGNINRDGMAVGLLSHTCFFFPPPFCLADGV